MSDAIVISVDAMGGDRAPDAVIGGVAKSARKNPDLHFLLHGDEAKIAPLVARRKELAGRCEIRHTPDVVAMDEKPSIAVRRGRNSSMWNALASVASGEAGAAVSAGNTGALMALALFCLRPSPGVKRPAIAALWPSRSKAGYNVVLDMGADIRADADDLALYAVMGAQYARVSLGVETPRVGLLNVGTEDVKGKPEVKEAARLLRDRATGGSFDYIGFVEGSGIFADQADVIVTDGFSGNIALKSAEGAAKLIGDLLRDAFNHTILSRLGSIFAYTSLRRLKKRIDPRRVNGGVFLGLNGVVVKSHGSADWTGFSAAVKLAAEMARKDFSARIAREVAQEVAKGAVTPEDTGMNAIRPSDEHGER